MAARKALERCSEGALLLTTYGAKISTFLLSTGHFLTPILLFAELRVPSSSSLWSTWTTKMGCQKNYCRKLQSTTSEQRFTYIYIFFLKRNDQFDVFLSGSEGSRRASPSQAPSSSSTRPAGKLWTRWRSSNGSRWTETLKRPKRSWRRSWNQPDMNTSSC